MRKIWLLNAVIFLAAFLLFQIELIIAKIFLPQYGGSYLVWGACIVFFQAALLLGYLFSHILSVRLSSTRLRYFHLGLLILPLVCFPGRELPIIHSQPGVPVVIDIFWQLFKAIGPVFFALSTVSIVLQRWLSASALPQRSNPYALYAVSNLGSFAAILTYPSFVEIFFDLDVQLLVWRVSYFVLIALEAAAVWMIAVKDQQVAPEETSTKVSARQWLRWFVLGAAGVIMFLSVTNLMTAEVAPIPLLWILPLCIYLISFVLNFKRTPWCPAWIRESLPAVIAFSVILFYLTQRRILPFAIDLILYNASLFVTCMFCQNELIRYKPADERKLTFFYVIISCGSFVGGILVSWVIPLVSTSLVEYLFGFFVLSLALVIGQERARMGVYYVRLIIYTLSFLIIWPLLFLKYHFWGLLLLVFILRSVFIELGKKPRALALALLSLLCLTSMIDMLWAHQFYIFRHRNYYGVYKIYDAGGVRFLMHATTIHGAQYLDEAKQNEPLTYFSRKTPVGQVMDSDQFTLGRIGIVGLGTGTLAAYSNKGRVIDFYELDPDVLTVVDRYFTYLKNAQGEINFRMGDARLSLEKAPDKFYDVIIVDAFSGDSIPVHLLTVEAIAKYREKLKDNGFLMFHVSNRYLKLTPVLSANSRAVGAHACAKYNEANTGQTFGSEWVAMTWDQKTYAKFVGTLKWTRYFDINFGAPVRPWSDRYSNVLSVVKLKDILGGIKNFTPFYW